MCYCDVTVVVAVVVVNDVVVANDGAEVVSVVVVNSIMLYVVATDGVVLLQVTQIMLSWLLPLSLLQLSLLSLLVQLLHNVVVRVVSGDVLACLQQLYPAARSYI